MTAPLRRVLLNHEISKEARRIAHEATKTCRWRHGWEMPIDDDHHTPACNRLKAQIEALALTIKLAHIQPPARGEPPPFQLEQEAGP